MLHCVSVIGPSIDCVEDESVDDLSIDSDAISIKISIYSWGYGRCVGAKSGYTRPVR